MAANLPASLLIHSSLLHKFQPPDDVVQNLHGLTRNQHIRKFFLHMLQKLDYFTINLHCLFFMKWTAYSTPSDNALSFHTLIWRWRLLEIYMWWRMDIIKISLISVHWYHSTFCVLKTTEYGNINCWKLQLCLKCLSYSTVYKDHGG